MNDTVVIPDEKQAAFFGLVTKDILSFGENAELLEPDEKREEMKEALE